MGRFTGPHQIWRREERGRVRERVREKGGKGQRESKREREGDTHKEVAVAPARVRES